MSAGSDIIERIKKLLRLARSSNPHEAQLAMQRALELAREHDVAVEGLNPDEQAKEKVVTHQDSDPTARLTYDQRYASAICGRFFRVSCIEREVLRVVDGWPTVRRVMTFVGTATDIQIASYVYVFLVRHFAFSWRKHRGRLRNRHAFVDGMHHGLHVKLRASEPPASERQVKGTELALVENRNYITQFIGETQSRPLGRPDGHAMAASYAGFIQGQKTEIRTPLVAAEPMLALTS
jgi:hypothetical protein